MGEFVTVSAVRTKDEAGVLAAVGRFFESCSWPANPAGHTEDPLAFTGRLRLASGWLGKVPAGDAQL